YFSHDGGDTIGVADADGQHLRLLGPGVWPHWSPDGTKLAFTTGTRAQQLAVWTMNADGSGRIRVGGPGFFARWGPSGMDVVFLRSDSGPWPHPSHLFSVRPGKSGERRW